MPETDPATIQSDLICSGCGYDLRGLDVEGRCPECGAPVSRTLLAFLERTGAIALRARLPRGVYVGLRDGFGLLLCSAALGIALAFAPTPFFEFKTLTRKLALAVACAQLILSSAGVWKLAAPISVDVLRVRDPISRRILRLLALVLAIIPVILIILSDRKHPLYNETVADTVTTPLVIGFFFFTMLYSPVWLFRTSRIMRALGANVTAAAAVLIAFFWPMNQILTAILRLDRDEGDINSLDMMFAQPSLPLRSIRNLMSAIKEFDRSRLDFGSGLACFAIVVPASTLVLVIVGLIAVIRAREVARERA